MRGKETVKWVGCMRGIGLCVRKYVPGPPESTAGRLPGREYQYRLFLGSLCMMALATQFLRDLSRYLTPAPPILDGEYDGLEYTWNIFVFRPARE